MPILGAESGVINDVSAKIKEAEMAAAQKSRISLGAEAGDEFRLPPVRDDLILELDAADENSYPGSGTTWFDISGNDHDAVGYNGTATFPVWQSDNGGRFYFNGSHGLNISTDMGARTAVTLDVWLYRIADTGARYIADARNNGGQWWLTNYVSYNINIHSALRVNDPPTYQYNSNLWGKWIHLVITSDASGSKCYVDGVQITDSRLITSTSLNENLGANFRIGNRYTGSGRWYGYMASFRLYSVVLSAADIWRNYWAHAIKFKV